MLNIKISKRFKAECCTRGYIYMLVWILQVENANQLTCRSVYIDMLIDSRMLLGMYKLT